MQIETQMQMYGQRQRCGGETGKEADNRLPADTVTDPEGEQQKGRTAWLSRLY